MNIKRIYAYNRINIIYVKRILLVNRARNDSTKVGPGGMPPVISPFTVEYADFPSLVYICRKFFTLFNVIMAGILHLCGRFLHRLTFPMVIIIL